MLMDSFLIEPSIKAFVPMILKNREFQPCLYSRLLNSFDKLLVMLTQFVT